MATKVGVLFQVERTVIDIGRMEIELAELEHLIAALKGAAGVRDEDGVEYGYINYVVEVGDGEISVLVNVD